MMRIANLMVIGLLLGICWGLIGCSASAGDYTIEKVIEIGPADWVPFLWPIKWSPDGTKISYFYNGYLTISDTLGHSRQAWKANTYPHKYEWLSNDEIFMHQRFLAGNRTIVRLSIIDINTGQERILVDNTPADSNMSAVQEVEVSGPERTVEGNVYYINEKVAGKSAIIPQSKFAPADKASSASDNHILRWGDKGLYLVRADMQDSTRLSRKPYDYIPLPPIISPDHKYIMVGGTIERIADSQYIVMDTCITNKPQKTVGCGFIFCSFNPKGNEILFQRGCDDGESYIVRSIGTFILETGRIQILDSIIHLTDCATPVYAPDGRKIAFQSNKKIYIIYRGLQ
ncbi:MAG: hypothetical protein NT002_12625 [candidate division Zixibacteria bacterium]|nr:hypothetical protein [candidate division Zixibacteria bacterium]